MLPRRQFLKFSPDPPAPSESHCLEDHWLHVSRRVMACRFEVLLPAHEPAGVEVSALALDEADRLEQQLSIFRESSEVSFVNRNAALGAVAVTPALAGLLRLCLQLYGETDGAFDITSGPLSRCWGFLRRQGRIPDAAEIDTAKPSVGSDKLLVDDAALTVRFARHGVEINLGSIGKGYALDRMKALLRRRVKTALLNAGASSFCAMGGAHTGRGWEVGIRHPRRQDRRLAVLRLRDVAMATSGDEEQFFECEGRRYGHILDPRTGYPAAGVASVTVVARSAAMADALATAFYVGGRRLAERYCLTHPEILVVLLETAAAAPTIVGDESLCDVEVIRE